MDWRKVYMADMKCFQVRRANFRQHHTRGRLTSSFHLTFFFFFFQLIKLLDGKRSQAVGILISSLHLEMKDIQQGEQNCFHMPALARQLDRSDSDAEILLISAADPQSGAFATGLYFFRDFENHSACVHFGKREVFEWEATAPSCSDKTTEEDRKAANTSCKRWQPHAINTWWYNDDHSKWI